MAMFGGGKFAKYNIQISPDFTDWTVKKLQDSHTIESTSDK